MFLFSHLVEVNEALDDGECLQIGAAVLQEGQHVAGYRGVVPAAERVVGGEAAHPKRLCFLVEKVHALEQLHGGQLLGLEVERGP